MAAYRELTGTGKPADLPRAADLVATVRAAGGTMITTTEHGTVEDTVTAIEEVCADCSVISRRRPRPSSDGP